MKKASIVSLVLLSSACGVPSESGPSSKPEASASSVTVRYDAGVDAPRTSSATRHLPGTIITTATGKYYYLVQSDGSISAFASSALVTASGFKLSQAVVTSADELRCYDRDEDIAAALPIPPAGVLRDGTLVKEDGRSAVYAISDGVAWPIMNQKAYDLAGYSDANVQRVGAGSLAGTVDVVGDCAAGIACLDEEYQRTCAKDQALAPITTATDTGTATATAPSDIVLTQHAAEGVRQHLPGTVITAGTGKYYLVNDDSTISPFASASLVKASGYADNMVIAVSSEEMGCYGLGDPITAALPAPAGGKLRDGAIVKETAKKDTYIVSGGVAWPVITGTVFEAAGYTFDATVFLPDGGLAKAVTAIGDCVQKTFCLTAEYAQACLGAEEEPIVIPTATQTATSVPTQTQTNTATATATQVPTQTQTATATATATQTATSVPAQTATSTSTATSTKTSTVTTVQPPPTPSLDLSWVYEGDGSKLCLNAAYFTGNDKAVLLIWTGPGADAAKGPVTLVSGGRFCWDFMNREKGLYYFWADLPDAACSGDICPRDSMPGNGAMYMTAPKATPAAREWLACQSTGCDGAAYWDGDSWTPMGG